MLGFIGRLDYQKGVDLIRDNYDWLMGGGHGGRARHALELMEWNVLMDWDGHAG
jgi:hypothetical protein